MPPAGFELGDPSKQPPHTYVLDRVATSMGTGGGGGGGNSSNSNNNFVYLFIFVMNLLRQQQ